MPDNLLQTILGRLGMHLPQAPAVDPLVAARAEQEALKEQQGWTGPRRLVAEGMERLPGFLKGITGDPAAPSEQFNEPGYGAGAMLGAAVPLFGAKSIPGMYSRVERIAESLPGKVSAGKLGTILKNRASSEELDWRKVPQFLEKFQGHEPVAPGQFVEHLQTNPLDVKVTSYGQGERIKSNGPFEDAEYSHGTQYANYVMPGASNYREDLLTLHNPPGTKMEWEHQVRLPGGSVTTVTGRQEYGERYARQFGGEVIGSKQVPQPPHLQNTYFQSHHWDEPNVLVHVRHNERNLPSAAPTRDKLIDEWEAAARSGKQGSYGPNEIASNRSWMEHGDLNDVLKDFASTAGGRGRMLENVQSDWHQRGAHTGYTDVQRPTVHPESNQNVWQIRTALDQLNTNILESLERAGLPLIVIQPDWDVEEASRNINNHLTQLHRSNPQDRNFIENLLEQHAIRRIALDNAHDAAYRAAAGGVPDAPFKDNWAELALKQQLLDIAHNQPDLQWLGIAPSSELRARGEVISPEFQDKQLPRTLEKLLQPFGGKVETADLGMKSNQIADPVSTVPGQRFHATDDPVGRFGGLVQTPHGGGPTQSILSFLRRPETINDVQALKDQIVAQRPNLHAPIAKLTPEMLQQIRDKGFPLLLALLAAQQNMQPRPSHSQ